MALTYLVNNYFIRITQWVLALLEYNFTIIYKFRKIHLVINAIYYLL